MQAMDIANDALDSVLNNFKIALKISIPVMLLNLVVIGILGFDFWQALFSGNGRGAQAIWNSPLGRERVFIIPLLFVVLSMYWVTVAWHRFVILGEQSNGMLPKLYLGRIWAYVWRLVLLAFAIGIVVFLFTVLVDLIFDDGSVSFGVSINMGISSEATAKRPFEIFVKFIGTIGFAYPFLRYSPFLVAAAIGKQIAAASGREATYWAKKDILLLAVGYAVMSLVYSLIGGGLSTGLWQIDLAITLALQWVAFMFTISLLTTLYQKSVVYYSESGQEDRILT